MRFEYEIKTFPAETGGYNLTAYTEGVLRLFVGTSKILDATDILLIELAIVLHKWLQALASRPADFYYASMDFEEEPILAFRYDAKADQFRFESVWSYTTVNPFTREDVVSAARGYLSQLREELSREHGVDLDAKLVEATLYD